MTCASELCAQKGVFISQKELYICECAYKPQISIFNLAYRDENGTPSNLSNYAFSI